MPLSQPSWREQFRQSLKAVEMEEPLDLALYRPLAFLLTRVLAGTRVTPNQVSVASLIFGVAAGVLFGLGGGTEAAIWPLFGAISYFLCNTLDCADGQLARLRGKPSPFGYIVDGSIDYAASVAVFAGMAVGLSHEAGSSWHVWLLAAIDGACYAWQCAILDRMRMDWNAMVYRRRLRASEQLQFFLDHQAQYRAAGTHRFDRVLISGFLAYHNVWTRLTPPESDSPDYTDDLRSEWKRLHLRVLRTAVWMGPTTQMSAIMLAVGLGHARVFLWVNLTAVNLFALLVLAMQRLADRQFRAAVDQHTKAASGAVPSSDPLPITPR